MSAPGFQLTRLKLIGSGLPDAEITFRCGLNVVSGPSDTGKTYIAQCINYILGGSKKPEDIPQAKGYESILLGLTAKGSLGEIFLERSLKGGDIRLREPDQPERILGASHDANDENNISRLLLHFCDLDNKKVRTNQQGKTRSLSFRDIAKLTIIDEETIISKKSPIFSGQVIHQTVESCIFRLLLSGVDDSSIIHIGDQKIAKGRIQGKVEVLGELLSRERASLDATNIADDSDNIAERLETATEQIALASAALNEQQDIALNLEETRRLSWEQLRHIDSRLSVLTELQTRFVLLAEQYSSDLMRLESILEAGARLGQMKEERCPVCGATPENQNLDHRQQCASPLDVVSSSTAEANKILALMKDLQETIDKNKLEISLLSASKEEKSASLKQLSSELYDNLKPRIKQSIAKLREAQYQQALYKNALDYHERISSIEELIKDAESQAKVKPSNAFTTNIGSDEAEIFSKYAEGILREWNFPGLDRVVFSEEDQDIVISGRRRSSHGKGVRAIFHAAFNLALLKYSYELNKPHPMLILIDSPLVVYREPDTDEGNFSSDVKESFYRSLAKSYINSQVIILENEDPPQDLSSTSNLIRFTGNNIGRRGFIPDRP